mmetsp:Transcript_83890/g.187281  ORF Transcript_83890/g.187281 Transcript_83890/m.187281 type:complete len:206 (+) Transcript_83890:406-1023(+)
MMVAEESDVLTSKQAGCPMLALTKQMHVTPPRANCTLNLNFKVLASLASSTWMLPLFVPASRKDPVSSKASARTSVSTFSFWRTMPLSTFTKRNTAFELAATKTCGLNGRKRATGTGEESVKTFSISPVSMPQKRTDLSIDVVTNCSSRQLKKHEVMARACPTSRVCTTVLLSAPSACLGSEFGPGSSSEGNSMSPRYSSSICVR